MLSQLTQIQADLINLKQEIIEIEMSSFSHLIETEDESLSSVSSLTKLPF